MNPSSKRWIVLHDYLASRVEPGPAFTQVLAWCEEWIESEYGQEWVDPGIAAQRAYGEYQYACKGDMLPRGV